MALPLLPALGQVPLGVVEVLSQHSLPQVHLQWAVPSSSSSRGLVALWGWRGCLLILLLMILCWRSNCSSRAWASSNSEEDFDL
jgi:hypothetical protein